MKQRIFHTRIDALRREVMDAAGLDLLIAYSDDILAPGAVRYLTDFDIYAMYGMAIVPRRGDVALAFGMHHSAYLVRVKQAATADHYAGTYRPGQLCAELLAESRPQDSASAPKVGMVGAAGMFASIHDDVHASLRGAAFVDVDNAFWRHCTWTLDANGLAPNLRRSATIARQAVEHAAAAFQSGQRAGARIAAGATLAARRLGADVMNRELVQVRCGGGMPLPAELAPPGQVTLASAAAFAIEISPPYAGLRSVCGRTLLPQDAPAESVSELDRAAEVHESILGLVQPGATAGQIVAAAQRLARDAGIELSERDQLGCGIGLEIRQPPYLSAGDASLLIPGMALAVRTRLKSPSIGTIHRADTLLVADGGGPDVLTVRP
jgi:Xaa-Pro aminopeptidase